MVLLSEVLIPLVNCGLKIGNGKFQTFACYSHALLLFLFLKTASFLPLLPLSVVPSLHLSLSLFSFPFSKQSNREREAEAPREGESWREGRRKTQREDIPCADSLLKGPQGPHGLRLARLKPVTRTQSRFLHS